MLTQILRVVEWKNPVDYANLWLKIDLERQSGKVANLNVDPQILRVVEWKNPMDYANLRLKVYLERQSGKVANLNVDTEAAS